MAASWTARGYHISVAGAGHGVIGTGMRISHVCPLNEQKTRANSHYQSQC